MPLLQSRFNRNSLFFVLLFVVALLILIRPISGSFLENAGWILAVKSLQATDKYLGETLAEQAVSAFSFAANLRMDEPEIYLGQGYAFLALEDMPSAIDSFRKAQIDPVYLLERSRQAMIFENYGESAVWSYIAYSLEEHSSTSSKMSTFHRVGWSCQKLKPIITDQPLLVTEACQTYLVRMNHNLIVNGEFSSGQIGWAHFQTELDTSKFFVEDIAFCDGKCACLFGDSGTYHGGWFQRIYLPENALIHYSFYVQTEGMSDLRVRLLYWEFTRNGQTLGNKTEELQGNGDWTYVETELRMPETEDQAIRFFPVLVIGHGTVCIDNVTVKIIAEN